MTAKELSEQAKKIWEAGGYACIAKDKEGNTFEIDYVELRGSDLVARVRLLSLT